MLKKRLLYFKNDQKERESRKTEQQYFSGQRNGEGEIENLEKCKLVLETCLNVLKKMHTNGRVVEK